MNEKQQTSALRQKRILYGQTAMRDDFSRETKETLAKRVGQRCSNPKCRKLTSGPHKRATKNTNIGVASHITAAAEGGPRFDSTISSDERKSIENAVWLCQNCAKLIDNDEERYTVGLLLQWKRRAEQTALREIEGSNNGNDSIQLQSAWKIPRTRAGSLKSGVTLQHSLYVHILQSLPSFHLTVFWGFLDMTYENPITFVSKQWLVHNHGSALIEVSETFHEGYNDSLMTTGQLKEMIRKGFQSDYELLRETMKIDALGMLHLEFGQNEKDVWEWFSYQFSWDSTSIGSVGYFDDELESNLDIPWVLRSGTFHAAYMKENGKRVYLNEDELGKIMGSSPYQQGISTGDDFEWDIIS
ncbi:MAG: hypothetical protein KA003_03120 [Caldilineaceae bacterium]|nr:hypothetical protein [Caldilineaceae bacterium]